jgi:hypothetical protein
MADLPRFHAFRLWRRDVGRRTLAAVQDGSSERETKMSKHPFRRIGLTMSLAMAVAVALAASPVAARSLTQVAGLLTPDTANVCQEDSASVATYTVTGNLSGCWYIDEWTIRNETPSGSIRASGTEVFSGCLDESRCGHFWTTYIFTYKVVDGVEAHGRCHHPIVGGDGGFAGVTGVLEMHDLPNGCAVYTGHLSF